MIEGAKAALAATCPDQRVVITGDGKRQQQAGVIRPAHTKLIANIPQHQQHRGIAQHHHQHIVATEGDGRGTNADADIVITIDHGVFGVVGDGPENIRQQQPPGQRRQFILATGKGHRNAKTERHPQVSLRYGKETFEQRITGCDQHCRQ